MPGYDSARGLASSEHDLIMVEDDATGKRGSATIGKIITTYHPENAPWDDLRFPATAINPPGVVSDPDWDTTKGGWLFAATGTETLFIIGQMPHGWLEGSVIVPHVHWERTTSAAGAVVWQLEYQWCPLGEAREAAVTVSADAAVATLASDVADVHQITSFGDTATTGKQISDMLVMKVSRLGDDAADTYAADARLLEFDIHHQKDADGSVHEFIK